VALTVAALIAAGIKQAAIATAATSRRTNRNRIIFLSP